MKKLFCCFIIAVSLSACKRDAADLMIGRWDFSSLEMPGMKEFLYEITDRGDDVATAQKKLLLGDKLILRKDSTFDLVMLKQYIHGSWTYDKENKNLFLKDASANKLNMTVRVDSVNATRLVFDIDEFSLNKIVNLHANNNNYYTVFSIAPMLIVIITLCDIFLDREAIEGQVYEQIRSFVGDNAALQIQELIKNATISKDLSWASVVGIIALIFAATSVFAEIQASINLIWRLKAKPRKGWAKILLNRLLSFSMVVSLGFIALVSLFVNAILSLLEDQLLKIFPGAQVYIAYSLNIAVQFATISFLFGIIFKVLPDAKIKWKTVRSGAFTTALLFMLGKFAIGYYLGKSNISSSYGAAGSLVIILLWVYYSAIILYFGAAFTRVYAQHTGSHIYPTSYAVWIQQIEVENKHDLSDQQTETKTTVNEDEIIIDKKASET